MANRRQPLAALFSPTQLRLALERERVERTYVEASLLKRWSLAGQVAPSQTANSGSFRATASCVRTLQRSLTE